MTRLRRPERADGAPRFPFMPLWVDSWLTSEALECLPVQVEGAFFRLLLRAWDASPPCTLPDDDMRLAVFSKLGPDGWKEWGPTLRRMFVADAAHPGRLHNPRQVEVYRQCMGSHLAKVRAAQKRWEQSGAKGKSAPSKDLDAVHMPCISKALDAQNEECRVKSEESPLSAPPPPGDWLARFPTLTRWVDHDDGRRELLLQLRAYLLNTRSPMAVHQYLTTSEQAINGDGGTSGLVLTSEQFEQALRDFLTTPGSGELRYFRRVLTCAAPQRGAVAGGSTAPRGIAERVFLKAKQVR